MTQLTTDKEKIKRLAEKMRAMNDEELVHYVENRIRKAEAEAAGNKAKKPEHVKYIARATGWMVHRIYCGKCKSRVYVGDYCCRHCGKRIDWKEDEE